MESCQSRRIPGVFLRGGTRPPAQDLVTFIDAHKDAVVAGRRLGVESICKILREAGMQVAASTYYAAKNRAPSARTLRDRHLVPQLVAIHAENYGVYGVRKLWKAGK